MGKEFTIEEIQSIPMGDEVIGGSAAVWLHAVDKGKEVDFDTTESDIDVYTNDQRKLSEMEVEMNGRKIEYVNMNYLGRKFEPVEIKNVYVPSVERLLRIYKGTIQDFEEDKGLYEKDYFETKKRAMQAKIKLLHSMVDDNKENVRPGRTLRF